MVNTVFEIQSVPPLVSSTEFSLNLWESTRARTMMPTFHALLSCTETHRLEFLTGARMMGYELVNLDDPDALDALERSNPRRYESARKRSRRHGSQP